MCLIRFSTEGGNPDSIEVRLGGQPPIVATTFDTTSQWKTRDAYRPKGIRFDIWLVSIHTLLLLPYISVLAVRDDDELLNAHIWQDGFVGVSPPPLWEASELICNCPGVVCSTRSEQREVRAADQFIFLHPMAAQWISSVFMPLYWIPICVPCLS